MLSKVDHLKLRKRLRGEILVKIQLRHLFDEGGVVIVFLAAQLKATDCYRSVDSREPLYNGALQPRRESLATHQLLTTEHMTSSTY